MHVGINLNQNMTFKTAIEARLKKGRASLFSLLSKESNKGDINTELMADLIQKVSLPVMLYGCELWTKYQYR